MWSASLQYNHAQTDLNQTEVIVRLYNSLVARHPGAISLATREKVCMCNLCDITPWWYVMHCWTVLEGLMLNGQCLTIMGIDGDGLFRL